MIQSPMTPIKRIKSQNWQVPYSNNQEKFKADWIWNHYITITPHLKCMDMDSWMVSTFYTSNDLLQYYCKAHNPENRPTLFVSKVIK